jgi:four helix bundle protein
MVFLTEKLEVYKKAIDFALSVEKECSSFPKGNYWLADQFQRASLSISLNIAEGNGRWHKKDRKHFFIIARGSAFECLPLIDICNRKQLINNDKALVLKNELSTICKMLTALARKAEQ